MVNYVNSYSIASDADHEALVINFLQRFPEVMPDGSIGDDITSSTLGSFIVDKDIAINLAESILKLMNDTETVTETPEE